MKRVLPIIITIIAVLLVTAPRLASAVPGNNPIYVTAEKVEEMILAATAQLNQALASLTTSLTAVEELAHDNQTNISLMEQKIGDLEQRLDEMESLTPQEPETVVFADARPQPFNSIWVEVKGYSEITFEVFSSDFIVQYGIHYTNNPAAATNTTGFNEQDRVGCSGTICPKVTYPILGDYYRISTGTAGGNITARGQLR